MLSAVVMKLSEVRKDRQWLEDYISFNLGQNGPILII